MLAEAHRMPSNEVAVGAILMDQHSTSQRCSRGLQK